MKTLLAILETTGRLSGTVAVLALLAACKGKEQPATPAAAPAATPPAATAQVAPTATTTTSTTATATATPPAPLAATKATWTPEALEELLAPVALYPDPVLVQVLTAATNPQEVLDAGNWLIANPKLSGNALDEAAQAAGFTPPIRGLIQSPQVIDQMCLNLAWAEELGQAYVNDQAGVMDAVQRLRTQAKDVGTLASSDKMKVETAPAPEPGAPTVIKIESPTPEVVYVPQYDPVAAYAPPAAAPVAAAPATTTTTVVEEGHSTGDLVTTGLLAFGAGILVSEVFDDDDDDYYGGGYGGMWYRPMPPYPAYPYRPAYGAGFHPAHGYNRPAAYARGNNNNVVVNQNNNYWNRYGNDRAVASNRQQPRSPISAARPNRPELNQLNADAARGPKRRAPQGADAWRGQGTYAGADPAKREAVQSRATAATSQRETARSRETAQRDSARDGTRSYAGDKGRSTNGPKVQGTYAGARPNAQTQTRTAQNNDRANQRGSDRAATSARNSAARPDAGSQTAERRRTSDAAQSVDRGRAPDRAPMRTADASRAARPEPTTAIAGADRGSADRAASQRGRQSAPQGVPRQSRDRGGGDRGGGRGGGGDRRRG